MMRPTVFFGPFIGEFGWELLFWQGWLRRACREEFAEHHRIVSSFPGREPLYPDAHEFWPVPEWFRALRTSGHAYITDGWEDGLPGPDTAATQLVRAGKAPPAPVRAARGLARSLPFPLRALLKRVLGAGGQHRLTGPDVLPLAERVLAEFERRLPQDTRLFVPWRLNTFEPHALTFGAERGGDRRWRIVQMPYTVQRLEELRPTPGGERALADFVPVGTPLVGVFPRCRTVRRSDKNWPREKYVELIAAVQQRFPLHAVALFGEPGGAYFAGEAVPHGCVDLINIAPELRFDVQLAALHACTLAVGSISGALTAALGARCPVVMWGYEQFDPVYRAANFLGTPMEYLRSPQPTVAAVLAGLDAIARASAARSAPDARQVSVSG